MISPGKKSQAKVRAPCPVIRVMAALLAAWFNLPPKLEQWKYSRTPLANNGKFLHNGDFLKRTVYWLLLCEKKSCQSISFWLMHFWPFFSLIQNTKETALKTTSPTVLVTTVQSTVHWLKSSLQSPPDSQCLSNLLRVKHLCHLTLLLLLPDPGLPAGLPAGLEATEEGQDLGRDRIFIS